MWFNNNIDSLHKYTKPNVCIILCIFIYNPTQNTSSEKSRQLSSHNINYYFFYYCHIIIIYINRIYIVLVTRKNWCEFSTGICHKIKVWDFAIIRDMFLFCKGIYITLINFFPYCNEFLVRTVHFVLTELKNKMQSKRKNGNLI